MAKTQPSKSKYRKLQKGRIKGDAKGNTYLSFGEYGLQALERGRVTARQLEAVRVAITRFIKRKGKVWMRVFPHIPITKKPAETRMGKGKGNVEYFTSIIKPGVILFELDGVEIEIAREAMSLADRKLGIKCRFILR